VSGTEEFTAVPDTQTEVEHEFDELDVDDAPQVGIVMGSKSDVPLMEKAADELEERGIRHSAALPGVVAAHTDLPVIGVPLTSKTSVAGGIDALLAIAQMPPGVPVATVGVDNPRNAAVLAARILSA
jgi:phosphoribosylcarboxyaminoimidazole (NCAIR) mutase